MTALATAWGVVEQSSRLRTRARRSSTVRPRDPKLLADRFGLHAEGDAGESLLLLRGEAELLLGRQLNPE